MKCYYATVRFLFFFLFFISPVLLKAQPKPLSIDVENNWEEAKIKAAEQGKFIFVDFTSKYCGACKKMEREVFSKPDVIDAFNKNFIFLRISDEEIEMLGNQDILNNIRPVILPTMVFYKSNARFIESYTGFISYEEFSKNTQKIIQNNNDLAASVDIDHIKRTLPQNDPSSLDITYKGDNILDYKPPTATIPQTEEPLFNPPVSTFAPSTPHVPAPADNTKIASPPSPPQKTLSIEKEVFENLGAKINKGNYTLEDLKTYAYMAKSFHIPYQEVADWYLVRTNDELSDENMQFVVDFANTTTARATFLMVKHIAKFKEKYGKKINIRISETLRNSVRNAPESEKKWVLEQALDIIDKAKLPNGNLLSFELKGMYYQGSNKWKEYSKLCKTYIEQYEISDYTLLNNIANTYAENVDDLELLKQALVWAKKSVAIEPHYDNYQTCAILYIRLNDMYNANVCKIQCLELVATELDEQVAKGISKNIVEKLNNISLEQ